MTNDQKQYYFGEKRFIELRCQAGNAINHFNRGHAEYEHRDAGRGDDQRGDARCSWR